MINKITSRVTHIEEDLLKWRRHIHQYPELSFNEYKTADYVEQELKAIGNLTIERPTETSVVARLCGDKKGKIIALRADMDALPIEEQNNLSFKSENPGVMHACGHDAHTSMALGAAKILAELKDAIEGEVRFIFQHAEELFPGGAKELVDLGVMDGVDQIICGHVRSRMKTGKVGVLEGYVLSSPDTFSIKIIGKGGHAAHPQFNVDSVLIASQIVMSLQHIASRLVDPIDDLVLSVTKIHGGSAYNVMPQTVEIAGTVRTFDVNLKDKVKDFIEGIVKGITSTYGATYELHYTEGYLPVYNDSNVAKTVKQTVSELYGKEALADIQRGMGGEDFSAYLQKAPGCFYYLGSGFEDEKLNYPHHHPKFTLNEKVLPIGVKVHVNTILKLLKEKEF